MQQQTCNNAVPSIPRPLPLCASPSNTPPPPHPSPPQPPAPAPALPLQPAAAPLSATPATHTPAPPAALQPNDQGPERTDSGGNGGSALDTVNTTQLDEGNDDDGMDIDRRPTRATRARNQPSTSSIPPPMPRLESGNKGKQTKRKQHNTVADAEEPSESVPNSSSHSDERDIRRRLFPKKLPEIPEISLVVSKKTAVPKMMPARTLYCAKGRPHEIVFRAHVGSLSSKLPFYSNKSPYAMAVSSDVQILAWYNRCSPAVLCRPKGPACRRSKSINLQHRISFGPQKNVDH